MDSISPIAPDACGCDRHADHLIPLDVAIERGLELATPVEDIEDVYLTDAIGRILAQDASAPIALPPFDNAAMDGYLVQTSDLTGDGPWTLTIAGRIAAGDAGDDALLAGSTVRIFTGAPVPKGFDAVVMQEDCDVQNASIRFSNKPKAGQHIRRKGGDAAVGQVVVPAGVEIDPRHAGALAAIGAGTVTVRRKVRVAIFSTGSELLEPGQPLGAGQIWNSNRYTLLAFLKRDWIEVVDLGAIEDTPKLLKAALVKACASCDMVITTGGVSVGDEDHMPRLFKEAGGVMQVMKVAIKPGKPVTYGTLGRAIFVGLPGNPVSAFVTWSVIGALMLEKRAGLGPRRGDRIQLRSASQINRRAGRIEFRPARYVENSTSGSPEIELLSPEFSGRAALLSMADGLVVIPADSEAVMRGEMLEFIPL